MKRVVFVISLLLCLFLFSDSVYAKKIKSAEKSGPVVEIKDENGNFYSVNTEENTVLYKNKKGTYEIIESEGTIELEFDGCHYSKTTIEEYGVSYAVSDACMRKNTYDLDTVESIIWAIEEANDANFEKKYKEQVDEENAKNTFWAIVISMVIIAMMVFVSFSSEDIELTD